MRNWIRRAIRTFFQAVVGFISANIAAYFAGVDISGQKAVWVGLITSAVAAGIAAVMNMREEKI